MEDKKKEEFVPFQGYVFQESPLFVYLTSFSKILQLISKDEKIAPESVKNVEKIVEQLKADLSSPLFSLANSPMRGMPIYNPGIRPMKDASQWLRFDPDKTDVYSVWFHESSLLERDRYANLVDIVPLFVSEMIFTLLTRCSDATQKASLDGTNLDCFNLVATVCGKNLIGADQKVGLFYIFLRKGKYNDPLCDALLSSVQSNQIQISNIGYTVGKDTGLENLFGFHLLELKGQISKMLNGLKTLKETQKAYPNLIYH